MNEYKHALALLNKWLTSFYDPIVDLFFVGKALQEKTLEEIHLRDGQQFLDIGCGTGTLTILVKTTYPNANVIGIDPDEHVLHIARKKAQKRNLTITFQTSGGEQLPFPANSMDTIVSSLAFHHMPTQIKKATLKEIYRILKTDGKFLLVDIGKPKNLLWNILIGIESLVEPKEYLKDNLEGRLINFMEDAGLRVKEFHSTYLGIQFFSKKII